MSPFEICCDGATIVTATCSERPLEAITVVCPDGTIVSGVGSVSFAYYAKAADCGEIVEFRALGSSCESSLAFLKVVKAELSFLQARGLSADFAEDELAPENYRWTAGGCKVVAIVSLTPIPLDSPYTFEMIQMVNGYVAKKTTKAGEVLGQNRMGFDGDIKRNDVYDPIHGTVTIYGDDEPGASWVKQLWTGLATIEANMNAWVYLRIACKDSGNFQPFGKLAWSLKSSLTFPVPPNKPEGGTQNAVGGPSNENTETPPPPN